MACRRLRSSRGPTQFRKQLGALAGWNWNTGLDPAARPPACLLWLQGREMRQDGTIPPRPAWTVNILVAGLRATLGGLNTMLVAGGYRSSFKKSPRSRFRLSREAAAAAAAAAAIVYQLANTRGRAVLVVDRALEDCAVLCSRNCRSGLAPAAPIGKSESEVRKDAGRKKSGSRRGSRLETSPSLESREGGSALSRMRANLTLGDRCLHGALGVFSKHRPPVFFWSQCSVLISCSKVVGDRLIEHLVVDSQFRL